MSPHVGNMQGARECSSVRSAAYAAGAVPMRLPAAAQRMEAAERDRVRGGAHESDGGGGGDDTRRDDGSCPNAGCDGAA